MALLIQVKDLTKDMIFPACLDFLPHLVVRNSESNKLRFISNWKRYFFLRGPQTWKFYSISNLSHRNAYMFIFFNTTTNQVFWNCYNISESLVIILILIPRSSDTFIPHFSPSNFCSTVNSEIRLCLCRYSFLLM